MRSPQVRNVNDAPGLSRTESARNGAHRELDSDFVLADGIRVRARTSWVLTVV